MPSFRSVGDILDFAMAREVQSHEFYMNLAERVTRPEIRQVIRSFAVDELQHQIRLKAIKVGKASFLAEEVGDLGITKTVPEIAPQPEMSYPDLLAIAMKREKAAFRLYTNLATIAKQPELRNTLLKLAQEEAQHKLRLEIEYDWETS
jgi:rubrerythrin